MIGMISSFHDNENWMEAYVSDQFFFSERWRLYDRTVSEHGVHTFLLSQSHFWTSFAGVWSTRKSCKTYLTRNDSGTTTKEWVRWSRWLPNHINIKLCEKLFPALNYVAVSQMGMPLHTQLVYAWFFFCFFSRDCPPRTFKLLFKLVPTSQSKFVIWHKLF